MNIVGLNGFLFGGIAENVTSKNSNAEEPIEEASASNDMFNISLGSTGMEWAKIVSKGDQPLPRWHHTANIYDNTQLIIFGGFHTAAHRLNDLWIFNIVDYSWKQPHPEHNKESLSPCPLSNHAWHNAPPARGAHTATIIGENMYVFGGYGGQGYSRRELDDLYALNLETMVWSKVLAKGVPPEKRSGHQACAIEKKIYVFGGWNSSTQVIIFATQITDPSLMTLIFKNSFKICMSWIWR
jgi:dynein heavy chain